MNKFEFKNLTPFKWFVLENFPFIEADFDALTEWQLFCKIGKEMNKIINSENILGTQMENVTNAFIELENYVNNYFDNLDVQDEINNKLNEMVEDGTLLEIIENYLNANALWCFNTVAEMKQATNFTNNSYAKTLGYHELNDGGASIYKIREKTLLDIIDESLIIEINNNLVAELIIEPKMNIEQFGAYGDNKHDDTSIIQKALTQNITIVFSKTYTTNGEITIINPVNIIGINNNLFNSSIDDDESVIHILNDNVTIKGINFNVTYTNPNETTQYGGAITIGNYYMETGFDLKNIIIEDVNITKNISNGMTIGIFGDSHDIKISNCYIKRNGIGIHWSGNFIYGHNPDNKYSYHPYNIIIENCKLENDVGIYCSGASNVIMNNLIFKNNVSCIQLVAGDVGDYLTTEGKVLNGIEIKNCEFNDCTNHTVFVKGFGTWTGGDNVFNPIKNTIIKIENCIFNDSSTSIQSNLLRIDYIDGIIINNCKFKSATRLRGIYSTVLKNAIISNCFFKTPYEPIYILGGENINIKNNNVELNNGHNFLYTSKYTFSPNNTEYKIKNITIDNNKIDTGFHILELKNTENAIITNNQFMNGSININFLEDNKNAIVANNRFSDVATSYILGHYNVRCVELTKGLIYNNYLDGSSGVLVSSSSDDIEIANNYIANTFSANGQMIEIAERDNKNVYVSGNINNKNTYITGSSYNYINYTENA